jgi:hypothetical protein
VSPPVAEQRELDLEAIDDFVKEDDSVIAPQLEGLTPARQETQRPESATVGTSRTVLQLREAVGNYRPQSAPLHTYTDRNSKGVTKSTVVFGKDASNAILLNNKAIVEQYERLIRPGQLFALKSDFKEMYMKKSEEFGMCVSEREIDRKLTSFHGVGKDLLSFEEFSVLFLHIAQW